MIICLVAPVELSNEEETGENYDLKNSKEFVY